MLNRVTTNRSLHSAEQAPQKEEKIEDEDSNETITFPVKKILEPKMIIEEKIQPRIINSAPEAKEVEDDELEIPAFIRRKMEK